MHSEKVDVLIEALPYVNRFYKQIIVIKYGGNAMTSEELKEAVLYDILLMKSVGMLPIIVHGGGPFISDMLGKLEIESEFVDGIRVTSEEAMEVVEMVLAGNVNNDIVKKFNHIGGRAIGISGMDDQFLKVKKVHNDAVDYGYVGEIEDIEVDLIRQLIESDYVPVISSVGMGEDGKSYNINADTVASAIAGKIEADKFMLLTDIVSATMMDLQSSFVTYALLRVSMSLRSSVATPSTLLTPSSSVSSARRRVSTSLPTSLLTSTCVPRRINTQFRH